MTDLAPAAAEASPPDSSGVTPSQTIGPFLAIVLPWDDGSDIVLPDAPGAITITGQLTDGAGEPVPDGLIEIWQADPDGGFDHPDDPRGARAWAGFRGFGRCATNASGVFSFRTLKPGALPDGQGAREAPHLDVSVFARGLLNRLVTRVYFPDETQANAHDPVLRDLPEDERELLIAVPQPEGELRFDIRMQGEQQTPFFAL
jgi:protocatechuate 3,4-dioxygenase alpha subunit